MRQLAIHLVCGFCLALPSVVHAQTTQPPAAQLLEVILRLEGAAAAG